MNSKVAALSEVIKLKGKGMMGLYSIYRHRTYFMLGASESSKQRLAEVIIF